jgi:peptide/nickel transport system substrate-binding protein
MYSPAAIADGSLVERPVGTGPWAFNEEASTPGTRLNFDYYEGYWGGRGSVGFDSIELYAIEDDTAAAGALEGGEIDITDTEVPFLAQFDANDATEWLQYNAIRNGIIFFDRGPGGLFEDANVRRAACYSLDPTVVEGLLTDIVPSTQQFAEGEVGHNPNINAYAHDLAQAQSLFAEAGNPSITAEIMATFFNEDQIVVYADQIGELGPSISVQTVPPPQFFSSWNTGQFPLGVGSQDETHPYDWYLAWFAAEAPNNPSGAESDALAAAADAAIAAGTSPEAEGLWAEVTGIIADEALTCGRMVGQELLAWRGDVVTGVAAPPTPWEPNLVNYRDLRPAG